MLKSPALILAQIATLAVLSQPAAAQTPRQTRDTVLPPSVLTSDDPQRIPRRPVAARQTQTVLKGGRVFDSLSETAYPATVVIEGRTIKAVLPPESRTGPPTPRSST